MSVFDWVIRGVISWGHNDSQEFEMSLITALCTVAFGLLVPFVLYQLSQSLYLRSFSRSNSSSSSKNRKEGDLKDSDSDTFESHVCEHDGKGLVTLSPSTLWHVTVKFKGNGPPWRRMIVYRLPNLSNSDSSLVLLSPCAVTDDVMSEIDKLGIVRYLIIPNSYHRTDAAVFKKRYPNAKIVSPPGWVQTAVSQIVPVDINLHQWTNMSMNMNMKVNVNINEIGNTNKDTDTSMVFQNVIKVLRIGGLGKYTITNENEADFEYAYEFKCADGTWAYAVTDTLFNLPNDGFITWLFGSGGIEHPSLACTHCATTRTSIKSESTTEASAVKTVLRTPRVGRISKWFMHSRQECAKFYRSMAERDDVSMILMAHGDVIIGNTKMAFSAIAEDLNNK